MDGSFDRESGIAHAARARRERNHSWRIARDIVSGWRADAFDNVANFVRQSDLGDPIGVSGLNEPFIVARGNVAADNDEEQVPRRAPDGIDQFVDVGAHTRRRGQYDDRSFRAIDRLRVDGLHARNAFEVGDCRFKFALDLVDPGLVAASLGQINRHPAP